MARAVRKTDPIEEVEGGSPLLLAGAEPTEAERKAARDQDILENGQLRKEVERLENEAERARPEVGKSSPAQTGRWRAV